MPHNHGRCTPVSVLRIPCGRNVRTRWVSTERNRPGGGERVSAWPNVASPAAYAGRVGGTMVLAGVAGSRPRAGRAGPTEGVISCGHFAVSGAAVGDHP